MNEHVVGLWEAREVHVSEVKASGGFGFLSHSVASKVNNTFMKDLI